VAAAEKECDPQTFLPKEEEKNIFIVRWIQFPSAAKQQQIGPTADGEKR
jgi:hypothetical protein